MIKHRLIITALGLLSISAINAEEKNDSVYIYLSASDDGRSGLMMSVQNSTDSDKWSRTNLDRRIVGSDFGDWSKGKKMFRPQMFRDTTDGSWHLVFLADKNGNVAAYTSSPDLISWSVQEFNYPDKILQMLPNTAVAGQPASIEYNGKPAHGTILKVEKQVVDRMKAFQQYSKTIDQRNSERSNQDSWRFAGIDTIGMSLNINLNDTKKISDKFIGIFFEDINYAADGGLYAELIQNRDFEYSSNDSRHWHALTAWSLSDPDKMTAVVMDSDPISSQNSHYVRLTTPGSNKYAFINEGFDGISVKKGDTYDLSAWIRTEIATNIRISIIDAHGKSIGDCTLKTHKTGEWEKLSSKIKAVSTCHNARLSISPVKKGSVDLDMVSLMPANTFKNRTNGLRPDLAAALADLKPRFVRFPGGCVAHGNGIDNIYDWKGSIGNLEERTPKRNLWGYHQSRGLGYHEFFEMCEDFGAEPLPVLAAGVPCQNSSHASHVSTDELTTYGQQCGIPMEEMPAYIQDILDLIEYANGDTTTTWGKKRAEAGHPAPFNLKMIGIGNEDIITDIFKERFLMIFNSIKSKYPDIEVVGTVGPFHSGPDYEAGWEFARKHDIPVVDEHYYVSPGWLIHNGDYYDRYDRNGTKVYLGEYASHLPNRASTLEAALSNALYLTNVERNADVVTMTSYAPLLAKKGHTQWRPDLIYFDNVNVFLTPDYYVQKMYGNNSGSIYVSNSRVLDSNKQDLAVRLGQSVVIDEATGEMIIKLVNMSPIVIETELPIKADAQLTLLAGEPDDENAKESTSDIFINNSYTQPPYSFSVLRLRNKR